MTKQITLTIDGVQVSVPDGTLVVDAAKKAGIDIPVFCYHPKMEPAGMCRMCLVEIGRPMIDRGTGQPVLDENDQPKMQFMPKLETACTNTVSEAMVVLTQSEKAKTGQKDIIEFLLTSHPLDCPICDKGGECPLQNLTMEHGSSESRFLFDDKLKMDKHVSLGELIFLDRERCILCGRCVRFQDEVAGEAVLAIDERGRGSEIISVSDPGFDSVFSGNTTDICPVGALTTADFRFGARPWELLSAASVCGQCPVGCNITFNTRREAKADGKVVIKRVMPRQNEQVNETWICDKGRFAYHYAESEERLTTPLVDGKESTWDAATKLVAEKLDAADKNSVVLASGRLSNEDLYNLKSLAGGLGGKAVLYTDMGGGDLVAQIGVGQGTNFSDMGHPLTGTRGDAILVVASDLYEEAPIWWLRVKQAADRGATLIVANSRETKLDRFANYVVRYANGDEVKTVQDLGGSGKIAEAFAKAENAIVLFGSDGLGLEGSSNVAAACADLLVKTGHIGKANNGLIGVWPKANDQGAWEMGFRPGPSTSSGLASVFKGKTVYIAGADPIGDNPALENALKGADFVVVQDLFQTATADLADVVLPAQAHSERDGTFTSGERRVQRFYPAVPALAGTKADYAITAEIASQLGMDLEGASPVLVFEKLVAELKNFEGLSYARLAEVTEQWPIVGRGDLYYGGTTYENTQGLGVQLVSAAERGETPPGSGGETVGIPEVRKEAALQPGSGQGLRPKEDELLAVPVTKLYDRGTTVAPAELLNERIGEATIALHPDTAKKLGVEAGAKVKVSFDGVSGEAVVKIDETISAGVALIPRSMGLAIREPVAIKVN